jgi:UDP-glucose 4-epimerase
MKKYIVIGGAGFIGSNLVDRLISEGHSVVVVDNMTTGDKENINPKAEICVADISSACYLEKITEAMNGCDGVFHLAALARVQPSIENPVKYNTQNVVGTLNILMCAKNAGVKRVIYSSSSSVYGETTSLPTSEQEKTKPISPYGLQKLIGEEYCKLFSRCYGIETVNLRYFNVYGERQPLSGDYCLAMGIFINQKINGKPITIVGDGEQKRDFTYVGDVVEANILAMKSKSVGNGESINIGNGDNRSINCIADLIGGEKKFIEERLEPKETLADNLKAKNLLGWEPTTSIEDWIPKYKKSLGI